MVSFSDFFFQFHDRIKILYSHDPSIVHAFIKKLVSQIEDGRQVIIVDPKRSWNYEEMNSRFLTFQPTNLEEFVTSIANIKFYISPRLHFVVIDDFHYFLRDYRGKSAKNVVINNRIFALCLSLLSKITESPLHIIGITYENPMQKNYPLSHKIINYYNCEILQILSSVDDVYTIYSNISKQFSYKLK
ncbi:MAG: hypothetical protein ACW99A_02685 [Candidatus Kariarchaeaceae archaeon]